MTNTDDITQPQAKRRRRWLIPVIAIAALVVGFAIGAAGETAPESGTPTNVQVMTADEEDWNAKLAEQAQDLGIRERDVTAREEEADAREDGLDEREAAIAAAETAAPEPPAEGAAPVEEPATTDTYTAGDYTFADIQVTEDFAGDFELRARATNGGGAVEFASWTATLFQDGTVVGALMGVTDAFGADETVTVTFIGDDAYDEWDSVEFQLDSEF